MGDKYNMIGKHEAKKSIPGSRSLLGWRINMLRFYRNPFTYSRWLHDEYGKIVALGQGNDSSYVFAFGPEYNQQILTDPDRFQISSSLLKIPEESLH